MTTNQRQYTDKAQSYMTSTRKYGLIQRNVWYNNLMERQPNGSFFENDFDTFHSRLPAIFNAHIERPGVVQGLEVIGPVSQCIIEIKTGVAIDDQGQMVVLASIDGYALVGIEKVVKKVLSGSLPINLEEFPNKKLTLTLEHSERVFAEDITQTIFQKDLIPWIRLLQASEVTSRQIVLAYIETDAAGKIMSVSHTDGTNQRQVITHAIGGIDIMRPEKNSDKVSQEIAGKIRPSEDGKGIEIDCILRVRDIVFIEDDQA